MNPTASPSVEDPSSSSPPKAAKKPKPMNTSEPSLPNPTTTAASSSPPTTSDLNLKYSQPMRNIPDTFISKVGWTREDLLLSMDERASKCWTAFFAELEKNPSPRTFGTKDDPEKPLPEGFVWGSYYPGGTEKLYAYKPICFDCGGPRHSTDHCPDFDDPEAVKYRKAAYTIPNYNKSPNK